MLSERLNVALNAEVGLEFFAYTQYIAMAGFFESRSLDGLAQFFYDQAEEEKLHGLKIVKYIHETDSTLEIPAIPQPQNSFASAEELAQTFLAQERHVTDQFSAMMKMAVEDSDFMSQSFLQWFIDEQREEVSTARKMLDIIRMAGNNLLMVEMMIERIAPAGQQAGAAN